MLLEQGRITYSGTTADFLAHAPSGSAPGRIAEAAYASLSNSDQEVGGSPQAG
jgi:hypothetical protein